MKLPLHGKGDVSVHRQLMLDASRGQGFCPDFMERTMVELGMATKGFFKKELSKRQVAKAKAHALYLARCAVRAKGDRAGLSARQQRVMSQAVRAATA